jgi:hypothetical protein
LQVGDQKLSVHRCVLAVHSSVFDRMFAAGLLETQSHIIKIVDFQYESVRALVEYMYMPDKINEKPLDTYGEGESSGVGHGGRRAVKRHFPNADTSKSDDKFSLVNTIHKLTEDVLALADKYDVKPLKDFCERLLTRRVNEQNLCEMVVFADTFK